MRKTPQQNRINSMIDTIKGDYKTSGKALIWGLAVGQWAGLIIIGVVFLFILVSYISSFVPSKQGNIDQQVTVIKRLTHFLETSARSINARKLSLDTFTSIVDRYKGRSLTQDELEKKIEYIASNLSHCNTSRGHYLQMFSEVINPFEDPAISEAFNKLIGYNSLFEKHAIDPQEEDRHWKELCTTYKKELDKANEELVFTSGHIQKNTPIQK